MRNLVPLRRAAWRLPAQPSADGSRADEAVYFCVNTGELLVYLLHERSGRIDALAIDDADAQPELLVELSAAILTVDDAQWRWIEYIVELDALVCGSTGGALVVVDLQTREPEEIGALEGGLVGMAWSSNQETLALATGVGSLLIMNTQWEVLHETQLLTHLASGVELVASATINMAWRDDAQYLVLNAAIVDGSAPVRKVLVFTHSLEFHAVGRLEDGRAIPHLGDALDWCPNHSLIASHEARRDQLFVVLFERNGLRHGEFALPLEYRASTTIVQTIQWNIQSDIVAVHVECPGEFSRLLLWTRSNYHWYLKQELVFDRAGDAVRLGGFHWDSERAALLHLLVETPAAATPVRYEQREFTWDISSGERNQDNGQSSVVVAVIDGSRLLLTPIHQKLVPPPMALHTLSFPTPVNSVAFDTVTETLAVALSTGEILLETNFLQGDDASTRVSRSVYVDPSINSLLFLRREEDGSAFLSAKIGVEDALTFWSVATAGATSDVKDVIPSKAVSGVLRACEIVYVDADESASSTEFALQTRDGCVVRVCVIGNDAVVEPLAQTNPLPEFGCLEVIRIRGGQYVSIGVTAATSKLLVDGFQVSAAACSSFKFCSTSSVLLYTTLGSAAQLRLVPVSALVSKVFDSNEEHRVIERGARLVGVVGDRASTVLQMPRGNLEGTSPRLLVLALVAKQVERLEYAKALEMGRRHRLDLNLLVDYNPEKFLAHFAEHLVEFLLTSRPTNVSSDRLCLFITNLHIVDVWNTKYGPQLTPFLIAAHEPETCSPPRGQDKVNTVCQAMMAALEQRSETHEDALLLPFLTAAVKQSPPDLQAALSRLQSLVSSARSSVEEASRAKRAMKHLIFLTQVDLLFDEALGMYDLDLVRFVAAYSQRDPKDYMPFLNACESEGDLAVRHFKIDVYLKRHSKALSHINLLLQRPELNAELEQQYEREAIELVVNGGLYDEALACFPRKGVSSVRQRLHRRVLRLKADFLVSESHFEDAGYVYLSIDALTNAMQAFKSARVWSMALATASRAKLNPATKLRSFAREVADALLNQKEVSLADAHAAAHILVDYCDNVDEAVALLVARKQWSESMRLAHLHRRADLVETDVETGVAVAYDALCDDIEQRQSEYVTHWKRLTRIREQKRLFKLHGIDGSRWEGGATDDTQSVASGASAADSALSTASSLRSVGSHNSAARDIGNFSTKSLAAATSSHFYATQSLGGADAAAASAAAYKSKRYGGMPSRAERRRRIKEGSVEEEVHVASQLRANAPSEALRRETRDLLRALVSFGHADKAETLQRALSAFEAAVRDDFPLLEIPSTGTDAGTGVVGVAIGATDETPRAERPEATAWRFPSFQH